MPQSRKIAKFLVEFSLRQSALARNLFTIDPFAAAYSFLLPLFSIQH
jgi:hypothetical protein